MQNLQSWAKNFNLNLIAFLTTICSLTCIGFLIYAFTTENLDLEFIKNTFALKNNHFVSERAESLTFILDTLLFIPLFYFFFIKIKKYFEVEDDINVLNRISAIFNILMILSVFMFLFIILPYCLNFYFDFNIVFIKDNFALLSLILFISLAIYYFLRKKVVNKN